MTAALSWPDPRGHEDGELVTVSGTVAKVTLEATINGDLWGELELVVDEGLPRLRCTAFPRALVRLQPALVPRAEIAVVGRFSRGPNGPSLHVRDHGVDPAPPQGGAGPDVSGEPDVSPE